MNKQREMDVAINMFKNRTHVDYLAASSEAFRRGYNTVIHNSTFGGGVIVDTNVTMVNCTFTNE